MIKFLKTSGTWAMSIITLVFTFAPETIFERYRLLQNFSDEVNVALNRVGTFIISKRLIVHWRIKTLA